MWTETDDKGKESDEGGAAPVQWSKMRQLPLVEKAVPGAKKGRDSKNGFAVAMGVASTCVFSKRHNIGTTWFKKDVIGATKNFGAKEHVFSVFFRL